jgi:hypothetical protein
VQSWSGTQVPNLALSRDNIDHDTKIVLDSFTGRRSTFREVDSNYSNLLPHK